MQKTLASADSVGRGAFEDLRILLDAVSSQSHMRGQSYKDRNAYSDVSREYFAVHYFINIEQTLYAFMELTCILMLSKI
jgi:hypothetical protein